MRLRSSRFRSQPVYVQMKTFCSVYGCVLRAVTAAVYSNSAVECLTVLLLDVLSAAHDTARHESEADNSCIAWRGIVQRLMDAESEVELSGSISLSAVTKKLVQMKDDL